MAKDTFTLRVFRYDPEVQKDPGYQDFTVPSGGKDSGLTVLEALTYVLEHQDPGLAFRYSCREAICGSCAMYISGRFRLACQTQVGHVLQGGVVTVSPLPHMAVIKDLVVDMEPFWRHYEMIKPYLINDDPPPERERLQSPEERRRIQEMADCILCAACSSSCPSGITNEGYIGPAAFTKAYRFIADSRDTGTAERLAVVANEQGIYRCHTIFNCVESCPKGINQTFSIQQMKRLASGRRAEQ
ncbi:MAG: succinate dehydrogenase iron-sulfur subunit [Symbiobacteriia bacterium]